MPIYDNLPEAPAVNDSDKIAISQSGVTRETSVASLLAHISAGVIGFTPVDKAGDSSIGPLSLASTLDVAGPSVLAGGVTFSASGIAAAFTGTGAVRISQGTTVQRPDAGSAGNIRWNSTTSRYEVGVGSAWKNFVFADGDTLSGTFAGAHTYSGAITATAGLTVSGAGTALDVTNNATVGGSIAAGNASTNRIQIAGSAGSPTISAAGGGTNVAVIIKGLGTGALNVQTPAGGNALIVSGSVSTIVNQLTVQGNVTGSAPRLVATGSDTNVGMVFQGKGGNQGGVINVNLSPFSVTPGTLAMTGTTFTNLGLFSGNASGSFSGNTATGLFQFTQSSDTVNKDGTYAAVPVVSIVKNWGGNLVPQGHQAALRIDMIQTGAVDETTSSLPPTAHAQYNALIVNAQYLYPVGGTGVVSGGIGAGLAFYPTVHLGPGATNYQYVSNAEWDLIVDGTTRALTIGGTATAGDTVTLIFTSTVIVGSPVSVVYTVAAGNTLAIIANGLAALVTNQAALANAGISAAPDSAGSAVLNLYWQGQDTVTVTRSISGGATVTATLGAVVQGASAAAGDNIFLANYSTGRPLKAFPALKIAGGGISTTGGSYLRAITIGSASCPFPIAPGGGILDIYLQNTALGQARNAPIWSPQLSFGFDLSALNFTQYSGSAWISPGMKIGATGDLQTGVLSLAGGSETSTIDVTGVVSSGDPTVVSGGGGGSGTSVGNYYAGDIVQFSGGQFVVASVNSSTGAVVTLTTLVPARASSTWGGGTIAAANITGGSGTGLTFTLTAVAATTINIGTASATAINIGRAGANVVVGSGAALATSATTGFLQIGTCAGTPTGAVGAAGKATVVVDSTNHKLYFNDGGGWVAVN